MRHSIYQVVFTIACLFWLPQTTAGGQPPEGAIQRLEKILEQQQNEMKQVKDALEQVKNALEKQKAELAEQNKEKYSN